MNHISVSDTIYLTPIREDDIHDIHQYASDKSITLM